MTEPTRSPTTIFWVDGINPTTPPYEDGPPDALPIDLDAIIRASLNDSVR